MATWSMRPAEIDDFDDIRALYAAVFDHERPRSHDWWKFQDNPAGPPIAMLAVDGTSIVGQYALWPTVLDFDGEPIAGAQSLDTMVHPEYRGQGMFVHLANATLELAAERGVQALYGFPNEASYPGFVRRLNWDHTGDVPRWVRVVTPSHLASTPGILKGVLDAAAGLLPKGAKDGYQISDETPTDDEINALLFDTTPPHGCSIRRDASWMRWRYADEAAREYRWLSVRAADRLSGLCIWGRRTDGQGIISEVHGLDDGARSSGIAAAIDAASQSGIGALHTVTNVADVERSLKRAGFIRRSGLPLIVRSMTHRTLPANMHDHDAWSVMGGDLDTL